MTQKTHQALLDTLAVQPHPLEVERQRVAAEDDGPVQECESDDWDHDGDTDDESITWLWYAAFAAYMVWVWLRGWWR